MCSVVVIIITLKLVFVNIEIGVFLFYFFSVDFILDLLYNNFKQINQKGSDLDVEVQN